MRPLDPKLSEKLTAWYDREKRDLPWRKDKDPYHVWISEIMLQQTRIETVIPYYERFLQELPNVEALASVPEERLLKLWEGLGYYSRARNLQKAAKAILAEHQGSFPQTAAELKKLPGIGPYTAGAIASISFNEKEPAVDGNVLRVLSRLSEEERAVNDSSYRREAEKELRKIYPAEAGAFTEALMELGERICLPNTLPRCQECPLQEICLSYAYNTMTEYPHSAPKAKPREEENTILVFVHDGHIALEKRPKQGLLAGLYGFPLIPGKYTAAQLQENYGAEPQYLGEYTHLFSHIRWQNQVWLLPVTDESSQWSWFTYEELKEKAALPSAFAKVLTLLSQIFTK